MTQYVRPMDLHSHNGGCELYGCIPVVPADEHNTALGKLGDALAAWEVTKGNEQEYLRRALTAENRLSSCELQRDEWKRYADNGLSSYADLQAEVAKLSSRLSYVSNRLQTWIDKPWEFAGLPSDAITKRFSALLSEIAVEKREIKTRCPNCDETDEWHTVECAGREYLKQPSPGP